MNKKVGGGKKKELEQLRQLNEEMFVANQIGQLDQQKKKMKRECIAAVVTSPVEIR